VGTRAAVRGGHLELFTTEGINPVLHLLRLARKNVEMMKILVEER
jgi:hypothetical protein